MKPNRQLFTILTATAAFLLFTTNVIASSFYKGKTLNLIVGYSPGGGSDITCRLFAKHLAKYIPGEPTVVVRNMPGGGGLKAMNYVGEAAKPDGTNALCGATNLLIQLLKDKALRVDLNEFNYIAGIPDSQVFYLRSDTKPGIKSSADVFKAQDVIFGGFRATSSKDLLGRQALDLFGVKYKYVTGIRGDGKGRKHIQQGFVNGWLEGMGSFISISQDTLVKTGIVKPIFQLGQADGKGELTIRNQAIPSIPTFHEVYSKKFGAAPSGQNWDMFKNVAGVITKALRTLALPPKVPSTAISDLRSAFAKMKKDDAFWVDARKVLGKTVTFTSGADTQQIFKTSLKASNELRDFMIAYANSGKKMARKKKK
jgi:tripartite-type tricarboxylate transporter receptor subunit TctC